MEYINAFYIQLTKQQNLIGFACSYSRVSISNFQQIVFIYRETKETRKENQIQVGMATIRDFENFKTRTKKSSDEVIRYFLRLDLEPGQNIISVSEEVGKTFDLLKTSLKMGANDLMKHLFGLREK
jgi:hypothetical protein